MRLREVLVRVVAVSRIFALTGLWVFLAAGAHGQSDDLNELMHLLSQRQHGQVSFVEQHFLKVLKRPAESYGEMIFDAPDRLEKRTVEPRPETLVLTGDVVTVERGGRKHVLDLKAYPAILPFIESFRATLAGDLGTLERVFNVDYAGSVARWTLTLVPRDGAAAKTVSRVRIEGSRDSLSKVEILETDGDRSLMTLRDHPTP